MKEFDLYLETLERFLDSFIDDGSDQELFAASYIHGHFSVVAANHAHQLSCTAEVEPTEHESVRKTFESDLKQSINDAINGRELSSNDAQDVLKLLDEMFKDEHAIK